MLDRMVPSDLHFKEISSCGWGMNGGKGQVERGWDN